MASQTFCVRNDYVGCVHAELPTTNCTFIKIAIFKIIVKQYACISEIIDTKKAGLPLISFKATQLSFFSGPAAFRTGLYNRFGFFIIDIESLIIP